MAWGEEQQQRFDALRQRELADPLIAANQQELTALLAALEAEEAQYLAPALDQMQHTQHEREMALAAIQSRNEALATRIQQHDHLLREAQAWRATCAQRRLRLHEH